MTFEEIIPNSKLRQARIEKGLTQAELAKRVGVEAAAVRRWERGSVLPHPANQKELCRILEKTPAELGLVAEKTELPTSSGLPIVLIISSYNDFNKKFVLALRDEFLSHRMAVWSRKTFITQAQHKNKGHLLKETIREAYAVLLIVSPSTQKSTYVQNALKLVKHYRRPLYVIVIDGEQSTAWLRKDYVEPVKVFDVRQKLDQASIKEIADDLEQVWLVPANVAELSKPVWRVPTPPTHLHGRNAELAEIAKHLQQPDIRVVTLIGPGGVGKTHLALQTAVDEGKHFVGGACFVPLATVSEPKMVITTIAQVLDIPEISSQSIFEKVKFVLKDKRLLLVLDNFEQIEDATSQLADLLLACAHLKILITSRTRLRLPEQQEVFIQPLALPNLTELAETRVLSRYAALVVFTHYAQEVMPEFRVDHDNAVAVAELCVLLDGLPLAIKLVASRIRSMSPQDILTHLLSIDSKDAVEERHRTLHDAIAWSYRLLTPEEQCLFRRLSAFTGGCTLNAVETVYALLYDIPLKVSNAIESLLDKSLLQSAQRKQERRLRLLEVIRRYSLERLAESEEAKAVHKAHAYYYLAMVEEVEAELKGPQQVQWLGILESERENLRAALRWCIECGEAELALRFCAALWWFWRVRGYWSEGRRWIRAVLELSPVASATQLRAKALHAAGHLAYYQDDYEEAVVCFQESLALYRAWEPGEGLAATLGMLGTTKYLQGEAVTAQLLLEESEQLCRTLGATWELAYLLRRLGRAASARGEWMRAEAYAQEGLALAEQLGDKLLIAQTLSTLAGIAWPQNKMQQTNEYNQRSLVVARQLGDKYVVAYALQNMGYMHAVQGNLTHANQVQEALILAQDIGDKQFLATILHSAGYIRARQGNREIAMARYRQGVALANEVGDEGQIGWLLSGLAILVAKDEQLSEAAHLFGATEKRLDIDVQMNELERTEYNRMKEDVYSKLKGQDFAFAYNTGRAMTLEQVLAIPGMPTVIGLPPSPTYPDDLTEQDAYALSLMVRGTTDEEIGQLLGIAQSEIAAYLQSMYEKIHVSLRSDPRAAAIDYAIEHDLV